MDNNKDNEDKEDKDDLNIIGGKKIVKFNLRKNRYKKYIRS